MRPFSCILVSTVIFSLPIQNTSGQKAKGEAILTAGAGLSIWNMYSGVANLSDSLLASSTPTFNATYDYGLTKNFSIGAAVGYNSFSFSNPHYSYINARGVIIYETISVKYSRVNVAVRPLYHWGKNENFEWHAGMRLGYSFWTAQLNTTDPFYKDEYERQNLYSAQVLIGSRAYFTEFLAITFDVGIGTPYFSSLGISLKL